jgi:hypothetical protein
VQAHPAPKPPAAAPPPPARPRPRVSSPGKGFSTGKSNFPARAGFWGRRDSQGGLVPLTDPALAPLSDLDVDLIPAGAGRGKRVLLSLGVLAGSALLSFLLAWRFLDDRQRPSAATAVEAPPAAPPAAAALPSVVSVPTAVTPAARAVPTARPHVRPHANRRKGGHPDDPELLRPSR